MSHIFLENSPILFANNFCKLNCTIYFIRRNFLAINLNKYWQKIMFAKKQYKNEYETFILVQIGDICSKWNHANLYIFFYHPKTRHAGANNNTKKTIF